MAKIRMLALGGQDETMKNCYVVEINDKIFIFNAGIQTPSISSLGVTKLIPDYSYLQKNKDKIVGLFIGYPTEENIGSLQYLLQQVGSIPIYTTAIGQVVLRTNFEKNLKNSQPLSTSKLKINVVEALKDIVVGSVKVTPFSICNSMPLSCGWIFETDNGLIVYMDEFIVFHDKNNMFKSDLHKLPKIINGRTVLALIVNVNYAGHNSGFISPYHKSKKFYEKIINESNGRVFIGCYDSNVYSIFSIAQIAKIKRRPFIVYSSTFTDLFRFIIKNKIFNNQGLINLPISEIENTDNAIVLITSNPCRLYANLGKIASGEEPRIKYRPTDRFIFGTPKIAGNEEIEAKILDDLARNSIVYYKLSKNILSMCAGDEDHKYLVTLLCPKYIIPISALYKEFTKYSLAVKQTDIKTDQIKISYNGEILSFKNGVINKKIEEIAINPKCIDTAGMQDIGSSIIYERNQMSENGVVLLTLYLSKKNCKFEKHFFHKSIGVFDSTAKEEKIREKISDFLNKEINVIESNLQKSRSTFSNVIKETKILIKNIVGKFYEKISDKNPIVLPVIVEI